jgi:hypothetical protein
MVRSQIKVKGPQIKEGIKDVFALGGPGYRFHVDGMEAEQKRREERDRDTPLHTRPVQEAPRDQEDQEGIQDMKGQVGGVEDPRVQTMDLIVQGEGDPSEWDPITGGVSGEGPFEERQVQVPDLGVLQDGALVVPIDEVVLENGQVSQDHGQEGPPNPNESVFILFGQGRSLRKMENGKIIR